MDVLTTPTEADAAVARTLLQALMPLRGPEDLSVTIQDRQVRIPAAMMPALIEAAKLISEGHAIDVIATMRKSAHRRPPISSMYHAHIF